MKKSNIMLMSSIVAFAVSVYMLAAAVWYQPNQGIAAPTTVSSTDVSSDSLESSDDFTPKIIKIHNGQIAVFEQGAPEPVATLNTIIDELPDETVKQLQLGITANTQDEYQSYLEDFS